MGENFRIEWVGGLEIVLIPQVVGMTRLDSVFHASLKWEMDKKILGAVVWKIS